MAKNSYIHNGIGIANFVVGRCVTMASHCQSTDTSSHSMTMQMDDGETMHAHDQMLSSESNNQSNCECDDNMNCSISGCSATALLNGITIDSNYSCISKSTGTN